MSKGKRSDAPKKNYILWLGTDDSLQQFLDAEEGLAAQIRAGGKPEANRCGDEDEERPSRLLEVMDGVAVISIHGSLTNVDSWINSWMGLISYNEIRAAIIQALNDESVHEILLDISSGGGAVAGVSDTANLIKEVNKIKRITTFSDGNMASAAYWLGSSAGEIVISNTAMVGSIGVIRHHMEYSKMLEKDGIKSTILRHGRYKALINPYEPLSELAIDEAEKQMAHIYQVFVQDVADNLGSPYPNVDAKMAQGREFVGSQALEVGMVDKIASFDTIMGELTVRASASTGDNNQYFTESTMKKKVMSKAQIDAAVGAGADRSQFTELPEALVTAISTAQGEVTAAKADAALAVTAVATATTGLDEAKAVVEAAGVKVTGDESAAVITAEGILAKVTAESGKATTASLAAEAALKAAGESTDANTVLGHCGTCTAETGKVKEAAAAATASAPAKKSVEVPAESDGAMAELRAQLEVANQKVVTLSVGNAQLKATNESLASSQEGLAVIARGSLSNMKVALGGPATDLSALSGAALVEAHAVVLPEFQAAFVTGGVASTTSVDDRETSAGADLSGKEAAGIKAARV